MLAIVMRALQKGPGSKTAAQNLLRKAVSNFATLCVDAMVAEEVKLL